MKYSWEDMARKTFHVYQEVSGWKHVSHTVPAPQPVASTTSTPPVLAQGQQRFDELMAEGENLARDRKFDEAMRCFEDARSCGVDGARIERAIGAVTLAQGDWGRAEPYFRRAHALDPKDAKTLCGLGMCSMHAGRKEEAHRFLTESLSVKADNNVALLRLIECAYSLNRFDGLEQALRGYLAVHPGDIEMEFCLAGCIYKQGRASEARTMNEALLKRNPNHSGATELRRILEEEAEARPVSKSVEVIRSESAMVQPKSDLSSHAGNFNEVDSQLLELEEMKRKGYYDKLRNTLAILRQRADLSPQQQETAQCLWAELNVLTDCVSDAEQTYHTVLERNPTCARALCGKGAIAASRSDWWGARRLFEEALRHRPEYDVALSGLGLCAAHDRDYDRAWQLYSQALESNAENMRALLGLIETGYVLKRLPDVESAIQRYLEVHPADVEMIYSFAGCCFAQGKLEQATSALETLRLFAPNHKNALELRALIEQGAPTASPL